MKFKFIQLPLQVETPATLTDVAYVADNNKMSLCKVYPLLTEEGSISKETAAEENQLANLFAAAPELLDALEGLIAYHDEPVIRDKVAHLDSSLKAARAAIAKAYGNQ